MPKTKFPKVIYLLLCLLLIFQQTGFAQVAAELNIAGHLAGIHSSLTSSTFRPLHLRYLSYDSLNNDFRIFLDKGSVKDPSSQELENTSKTLLDYFFIGLTLPNDSFWVNLRPDAEDNVIDNKLAFTDVGRIMLESDLQLKKDTAGFTSPKTPEGRQYWDKLYKKAGELFGSENITIPTLTRPWIVPGEIIIRETADSAYIYKATLKVMLEQDYLANGKSPITSGVDYSFKDPRLKELNEYSSQLIRELIIPKLTKKINSSKEYAALRQVYYSLIIAQWFKARFNQGQAPAGTTPGRINSQDLTNLTSKEPWSKTTYFQAYQKSFKDGEYSIREPVYTPTGQVIRSYFSGGEILKLDAIPTGDTYGLVSSIRVNSLPILNPDRQVEFKIDASGSSPVIFEQLPEETKTEIITEARNLLSKLGNVVMENIQHISKEGEGDFQKWVAKRSKLHLSSIDYTHRLLGWYEKLVNENKVSENDEIRIVLKENSLVSGKTKIKYFGIPNFGILKFGLPGPFRFDPGLFQLNLPSSKRINSVDSFFQNMSDTMGEEVTNAFRKQSEATDEIVQDGLRNNTLTAMKNSNIRRFANQLEYIRDLSPEQKKKLLHMAEIITLEADYGIVVSRFSAGLDWGSLDDLYIYIVKQNEGPLFIGRYIDTFQIDKPGYTELMQPLSLTLEINGINYGGFNFSAAGSSPVGGQKEIASSPVILRGSDIALRYTVPINIVLAPGGNSSVSLQVVAYQDLPETLKGLNPEVRYFIIDDNGGFKGLRDGEDVFIGRDNPGRFALNSYVSGRHLKISRKDDTIIIVDLGSTNKTSVALEEKLAKGDTFEIGTKLGPNGHLIAGGVSTGRSGGREIIRVDLTKDAALRQLYNLIIQEAGISGRNGALRGAERGDLLKRIFDTVKKHIQYDDYAAKELEQRYANKEVLLGEAVIDKGGVCRHQGIVSAALLEHFIQEGYLTGQAYYFRGPGHGWAIYRTSAGQFIVFDVAQNYLGPMEGKKHYGGGGRYYLYSDPVPSEVINQPLKKSLDHPTIISSSPAVNPGQASQRASSAVAGTTALSRQFINSQVEKLVHNVNTNAIEWTDKVPYSMENAKKVKNSIEEIRRALTELLELVYANESLRVEADKILHAIETVFDEQGRKLRVEAKLYPIHPLG
jgi:hypothetical protein